MPDFFASNDRISSQGELRKLKLCNYLINYFHYVWAKLHPNPTFLKLKVLARQKVVKAKSTNFTKCPNFSASNDRISSQSELRKMKLCMYLINYFHYVCAKFHPNRTIFSVKGLAMRKVAEAKSTNFTRCPNFFASNDTISTQGKVRKSKPCMYLIKYFHYVCTKIHPNRTIFSVKRLAKRKVAEPKSTNFTRSRIFLLPMLQYRVKVKLKRLKFLHVVSQLQPLYVC